MSQIGTVQLEFFIVPFCKSVIIIVVIQKITSAMEPFSKVKGDLIKMAVDFDSKAYLEKVDAWWRATNYLSAGMIF